MMVIPYDKNTLEIIFFALILWWEFTLEFGILFPFRRYEEKVVINYMSACDIDLIL